MTTDTDARDAARHRYQRTVDMVRANVGDPQPVAVPATALWVTVGHSSLSKTDAVTAVRAARENGAVVRHRDAEGRWRYGLTADGIAAATAPQSPYGPADRERFERVVETEVAREDPDKGVIGWANRRLAAIDERAGET